MNWLQRIRSLIGKFWTVVCQDAEFVLGMCSIHAAADRLAAQLYRRWSNSYIAKLGGSSRHDLVPVVLYLVKTRLVPEQNQDGTITVVPKDCITKPPMDLDDVLAGPASNLNAVDADGGWQMPLLQPGPQPRMLTDHVLDYKLTLIEKMDYDWYGDHILFHMDPEDKLNLPEVRLYDADGNLCTCYKVFGWFTAPALLQDAVAGCESPALSPFSATAWEMHQEGGTYYNVKKLMAEVTGAVVSGAAGIVSRKWNEQGHTCLQMETAAYTAPDTTQCNVVAGDHVSKGDILMGTLVVCSGNELDYEDSDLVESIPGIRVRTDVGELFAANEAQQVYTQGGVDILPLTNPDDSDLVQEYKNTCEKLAGEAGCPQVVLTPDQGMINPFRFIMQKLRRGRSVLVSATVKSAAERNVLSAALDCVRRNMPASGMLTAYMRAESEPASVLESARFTASGGNAAVAVAATVKVERMEADTGVVI